MRSRDAWPIARLIVRVAQALDGEDAEQLLEPAGLDDEVVRGDADVVEVEVRARDAAEAHQLLAGAEAEARGVLGDDDRADALGAWLVVEPAVER